MTGEPFPTVVEGVRWLGAVQSQDYGAAKWALGQRTRGATDAELDVLFDAGALLRTHVLRPTWHFVLPEDIRWLLRLTAPRIRAGLTGRYRQLEIDGPLIARAEGVLMAALETGGPLTRPDLGVALREAGISPDGQRLPHLLMAAELDALIASGPRRGRQFTYAPLDGRAHRSHGPEGEEALGELALRYFRSRGPAQLADFAWWSGLTLREARTGVRVAGPGVGHLRAAGKDYWFDAQAAPASEPGGLVHLLPNFDEYTVAYRDREAILDPEWPIEPELFAFGSVLSNVVLVGGLVRGAWRRRRASAGDRLEVTLLGPLQPAEREALDLAAERMSRFLQRPLELSCEPGGGSGALDLGHG